jgi:predicted DCC family thiol-disulfide oxidoreductase YuxK
MKQNIVFYDGVCGLCDFFIQLLVRIDKKRVLRYATLQSTAASKLLPKQYVLELNTVAFYQQNQLYDKSTAVIKIFSLLGFPFNIISLFVIIPKPMRDFIYMLVAKYRYRIFGKREQCRLIQDSERDLFLE